MGNLGTGELIIIFIFCAPAILWIVALIDILKNNFQGNSKLIWVLVVIFLPVIGSLLYFVIGRNQKISTWR